MMVQRRSAVCRSLLGRVLTAPLLAAAPAYAGRGDAWHAPWGARHWRHDDWNARRWRDHQWRDHRWRERYAYPYSYRYRYVPRLYHWQDHWQAVPVYPPGYFTFGFRVR